MPDIGEMFYYGVKILVIAAGIVIGWLAGSPIARLLARLAFHRPAPYAALLISRIAFAALFGFLFSLIPIGPGGPGGGLFGGKGKDKGGDKPEIKSSGTDKPGTKLGKERDDDRVLSVRVLGGKAVKVPFYYVVSTDGKERTVTRADLAKIIETDKAGSKRYKRLEIHLDDNSVRRSNPVVTHLEDLAGKYKLGVRVTQDIPAGDEPDGAGRDK